MPSLSVSLVRNAMLAPFSAGSPPREPIAEHLLGGKPALLDPLRTAAAGSPCSPRSSAARFCCRSGLFPTMRSISRRRLGLSSQHIFDLRSSIADRRAPSAPRGSVAGDAIELEKMPENSPVCDLMPAAPISQALDLLGEVLPVERQVGALGVAQRRCLLLGPQHEIPVVQVCRYRPSPVLPAGLARQNDRSPSACNALSQRAVARLIALCPRRARRETSRRGPARR